MGMTSDRHVHEERNVHVYDRDVHIDDRDVNADDHGAHFYG